MLVLQRMLDQEVVIIPGDGLSKDARRIVVKVIEIKNGSVKLGIAAPPSTTVHRAEIQQRVDSATNDRRQ